MIFILGRERQEKNTISNSMQFYLLLATMQLNKIILSKLTFFSLLKLCKVGSYNAIIF